MATLREILKRDDWRAKTAQQCVDDLSATVELSRDSTAYTWSGLAEKLVEQEDVDPMVLVGFRSALPSVTGAELLQDFLLSGGADFSKPALRAQIAAIIPTAGEVGQTVLNAMLSVGIKFGPLWQKEGLASLPAIAEIDAARTTIATDAVRQQLADRYNEVVDALDAGQLVATWDTIRAALGAE